VVILLCGAALVLLAVEFRAQRSAARALAPLAVIGLAALCLGMTGPTAVWRHGSVGAGRARLPAASQNDLRAWSNDLRRHILWQADGRESSVALSGRGGLSFLVNGKTDGNAVADAGTQMMLGVLGAILHPDPKSGLIIGLGTGESAGWLASLPEIERVDVVELEPTIRHVAELCTPLNHDVLHHPKVRIQYNDAREALQTTRQTYDLIASEPSNPYRSGVASLYTREFYEAARQRLRPGGIFIQWLQGYEVDGATVRTVLATLHAVFPQIQIWDGRPGDLLLVCSTDRLRYDLARIERRVQSPAYREALRLGWRTTEVAGVLAHFIASERYVTAVARQPAAFINTDDLNLLEYSFARTVGQSGGFTIVGLRNEVAARQDARPPQIPSGVDWRRVYDQILVYHAILGDTSYSLADPTSDQTERAAAWQAFLAGRPRSDFTTHFEKVKDPARDVAETAILAMAYADQGNDKALPLIDEMRASSPVEADMVAAVLAVRKKQYAEAVPLLERAYAGLRRDPTVLLQLPPPVVDAARIVAESEPAHADRLYQALKQPFAVFVADDERRNALLQVARKAGPKQLAETIETLEPLVPWDEPFLRLRWATYQEVGSPRAAQAERDLARFLRHRMESRVLGQ
jgi:hypothetical protein